MAKCAFWRVQISISLSPNCCKCLLDVFPGGPVFPIIQCLSWYCSSCIHQLLRAKKGFQIRAFEGSSNK